MLLPYSLGLVVPAYWYQIAFAIWMLLLAGCIFFVLQRWRSRRAALAYTLYLLVVGWSTVAGRLYNLSEATTNLIVFSFVEIFTHPLLSLFIQATLCVILL